MATIEEIAKEVIASINSDANYLLAVKWADTRYKQMVSRARFRHLREQADVAINTYTTAPAILDCPTDLRWFGPIVYDSNGSTRTRVVQRVTIEELDDWYPTRAAATGGPRVYAELGLNGTGTARQIEIYPVASGTAGEELHFTYWEEPTALTLTSSLPFGIEEQNIREGVLVDLYRYEIAKAIRNNEPNAATMWAQRTAEQEARWEMAILEAIRADQGEGDDLMLIEQKQRCGLSGATTSSAKYPSR